MQVPVNRLSKVVADHDKLLILIISQFSMFRINWISIDFFLIQAYHFRNRFFIIDFFENYNFITKNEPNFCGRSW